MTTIAARFGLAREVRTFQPHPDMLHNVSVGLEVELENLTQAHLKSNLNYWQMGEDGSLRPRNTSAELRFALPLFGSDIISALNEFDAWLNRPKFKLDLSDRCSLHCHVDVRDLHIEQLENFWTASLLVEGALFSYAGKDRAQSVFCLPLSQRKVPSFRATQDHLLDYFQTTQKYVAINPNNIGKIGTVEFRMHKACADVARMKEWVNLLICLREYSKNISGKDLIYMANDGREQCIRTLFGPMADVILPHINFNWQESISSAASFAYRDELSKNAGYELVLRKLSSKEEE